MPLLSISTYSFGPQGRPLPTLEVGLRLGFQGLELGSFTYWPETLDGGEIRQVQEAVRAHGLALSVHFVHRGVSLGAHQLEERRRVLARLQETVRLTARLGGQVVVVHLGTVTRPVPPEGLEAARQEARALALDTLHQAAQVAQREGVFLCLENTHLRPNEILTSYADYVAFLQEVGSPHVALTLDFGHAHVSAGVEEALATLGPHLLHLHLHDNPGDQDAHAELGTGTIPLRACVPFLRSFPSMAVLEVQHPTDPQGALARSLATLRRLLGEAP